MIRITDLTKRYDRTEVLRGINIHGGAGELFGFLGPNGAGKTTTLLILAGLLEPTSGRAAIAGFEVGVDPLEVERRIGYVPDRPFIYDKLSARELLALYADLYAMDRDRAKEEAERWLSVFGLAAQGDELIAGYSHGMKQRAILAATLLHDPEVLIVDEPMVGLDPQGARLLKNLMRERCDRGRTVLMSTHTLNVAEETCDRVGIIHRGEILAIGTVAQLRSQLSRDGASLEEIFLEMTGQGVAAAPASRSGT